MSQAVGLDRAVEYVEKLEKFRAAFEGADRGCQDHGDTVRIETGRKFDRVFIKTASQNLGRYFVDRNSWVIYGIKSWHQVNERRVYGTLDTVEQWDWSPYYAVPKPGTEAERLHAAREAEIAKNFRPRGRPRKNP